MAFPVDIYVDSFTKVRAAKFGSLRSNDRKHAGCDLYVPDGTPVRAIAKGVIRSDLSHFYERTASLVIDHFFCTVRYGELSFEPPIVSGVYSNPVSGEVEEGRILGYVKRTNYIIPMLHFEMFSGSAKGPLTVRSNKPTQRRSDLMDPTEWLTEASRTRSSTVQLSIQTLLNNKR